MSVDTTIRHTPYTIEDLADLPRNGNRYEVLEGALIVTPSPDTGHQYLGDELRALLQAAAPPGVRALTAMTVRLGTDETGLIPDVVVTTVDPARRLRVLDPADVMAVVEVVSPSSRSKDRVLKPDRYAAFGIDCYWRVELDPFPGQDGAPLPVVLVHDRVGAAYRVVQCLPARTTGAAELPFDVRLDPGALLAGR